MTLLAKIARAGIKLEALQIAFCVGGVCGMLFEAVVITVPKIAFVVLGRLL
jgi:hypothetical protein